MGPVCRNLVLLFHLCKFNFPFISKRDIKQVTLRKAKLDWKRAICLCLCQRAAKPYPRSHHSSYRHLCKMMESSVDLPVKACFPHLDNLNVILRISSIKSVWFGNKKNTAKFTVTSIPFLCAGRRFGIKIPGRLPEVSRNL